MELINGLDLYQMFNYGSYHIVKQRTRLNDINVFPVPDGDTGDNLTQTLKMIVLESDQSDSFQHALKEISESALLGARGNSGVIFAQFVNGLQMESIMKDEVSIDEFATMVQKSYVHTVASLSNPVEGTMITILREWGESLKQLSKTPKKIKEIFTESFQHIQQVLQKTPNMLNMLGLNKVIDSGALGFVLFVKGVVSYYNNEPIEIVEQETVEIVDNHANQEELTFRYCTEGLVKYDALDKEKLQHEIESLGDSLIIAQGKTRFRVHIHTNNPEILFDKLKKFGEIEFQKVDDMELEVRLHHSDKKRVLITDSIADIDKEFIENNNVVVIPVHVNVEGTSYLDKLSITNNMLLGEVNKYTEYPKTATPSMKLISDLFTKLLLKFDELIVLTVSSQLSGTHQVIRNEAEKLVKDGKKIHVIDSLNNSATEGLLVRKTVELMNQGLATSEIIEEINIYREKTKILVSLNTFKYATLSGRVPKIIGKIAMFLGIRPILSLKNGKGTAYGMRFSQSGITKKIVKLVKQDMMDKGIESYSIVHCMNEATALEYKKVFTEIIGFEPTNISEISSATAIHSGVGSVAIGYLKN